ncbi:glyoxalase [Bacillus sp. CHD6a]|uniref:glyoxalase n=1 Tax=Bacillus sp. CHD6a TaxID=1643452 RepID=UPI000B1B0D9F
MKNLLIESHCIFPSHDILKTAGFYEQKMGFKAVHFLKANEPHICLSRDTTEIILTKTNGQKVISNRDLYGNGYDAYFKNQEELQEELINSNVKIARSLENTDYNNKEFVVEDIDGNG